MPRKGELIGVSGTETIVGTGVRVKGNIISEGDVSIDGALAGSIKAGGSVNIGVNAVIKGDIEARAINVGGQLEGNVKVDDEASISETGRVKGDITASSLAIGAGAIFVGTSHMRVHENPLDKPELQ